MYRLMKIKYKQQMAAHKLNQKYLGYINFQWRLFINRMINVKIIKKMIKSLINLNSYKRNTFKYKLTLHKKMELIE